VLMGPPASNPYSVGTLQRLEDDMDHRLVLSALGQVDVHDPDTQRIKCLDVENILGARLPRNKPIRTDIRRTLDVHLIAPFAKAPNSIFLYENQLNADKEEKSLCSETPRTKKICKFFFFLNLKHEAGVGENSGSNCKDNHQKGVTDFVDVIKVARSQHVALKTRCVEECWIDPLPYLIQQALKSFSTPFFQAISLRVRFYIFIVG